MTLEVVQDIKDPDRDEAWRLKKTTRDLVTKMIRRLSWEDFDALVYRLCCLGFGELRHKVTVHGESETYDLEFYNAPMTDQKMMVRVAYAGTDARLDKYMNEHRNDGTSAYSPHERLYYIYHSAGKTEAKIAEYSADLLRVWPNVEVMGSEKLAKHVVAANLVGWLSSRVGESLS